MRFVYASRYMVGLAPAFIELAQDAPTRRQLSDGVTVFLSGGDRIYAKVCPAKLSDMVVEVGASGDALSPVNPRDHILVAARLARRQPRHPSMQPLLAASLYRCAAFCRETALIAAFVPDSLPPFVHIEVCKSIFPEAARRALREMEAQRRLPAAIMAHMEPGVLRASRRGDSAGVARGARGNRDLLGYVNAGRTAAVDPMDLVDYVRTRSIGAAAQESRCIADSLMPEGEKRHKVEGARTRVSLWNASASEEVFRFDAQRARGQGLCGGLRSAQAPVGAGLH